MSPHTNRPSPTRLTSLKSRFAKAFLRALVKINKRKVSCISPKEVFQRYQQVKTAADKSLACAVGSRRPAWSRAVLSKIRNQSRRRYALARRRIYHEALVERTHGHDNHEDFGGSNELRRLVPGGEAMNLCSLLEEAADYIKCLHAQVQVMRRVADHLCST